VRGAWTASAHRSRLHADLLQWLGIDPGDLAGSLGGIGNKLGL